MHCQWEYPDTLLAKNPRVRRSEPAPDQPRLRATRHDERLRLAFDFSGMPVKPIRLIATVNSSDEETVPPRAYRFGVGHVEDGKLHTSIPLERSKHYDVAVAVVVPGPDPTGPGAQQATLAQPFTFVPGGGLKALLVGLLRVLGRVVHLIRVMVRGRD
jgi:hypothetical protein